MKDQPNPAASEPWSIPTGWAWSTMGEAATVVSGGTPSTREPDNFGGDIPWITPNDLSGYAAKTIAAGERFITQKGLDESSAVLVPPRTVLFSSRAPIGYVVIAERQLATNQGFKNFILKPGLEPDYVYYYLQRAKPLAIAMASGTTFLEISAKACARLPIPIPPISEQRRIVAKIEELFSDLDAGVTALQRVRANLKRYRAAVLKAAVEGRLTEEWRSLHRTAIAPTSGPGSPDPSRPGKKRAGRLWGAGFVPELTTEERSRVPATWTWMKVRDLGPNPEEVVQVGPMSMKSSEFSESGVPVLNVGCVQWDWIEESKLDFLPEAIASRFDRYRVRRGDVLFTRSGTVGRCAVASSEQDGWLMTFHLLRARPDPSMCQPRFLRMVFEGAPHIRRQREKGSVGSTRAGFNTNLLASLDVSVPPFAEQTEIVAEVDRRLSAADAAETQVEHTLQRATRFRQAILKRAFEGKLVAQDACDDVDTGFLSATTLSPEPARAALHIAGRRVGGVNFRRGAIAAYAVQALHASPHFGRTQLEKVLHIVQAHLDVDLSLQFKRHAAGPFDKAIFPLESLAQKKGWFTAIKRPKYGVRYEPGPNIRDRLGAAHRILGGKRDALDMLLRYVRRMDTEQAELFATVYAAWNDLLIDQRPTEEEAIIAEVHGWHPSKLRFTPARISECIRWLRRKGIVPRGTGGRTQISIPGRPLVRRTLS